MGTATVRNQSTVSLTTQLSAGKLHVYYGATVIGTMNDEFCQGTRPPSTVRLNVAYLPDGTPVSGTWGNDVAFVDDPTNQLIYAIMPMPSGGSTEVSHAFTISEGAVSDDPHLVLKTNVDC